MNVRSKWGTNNKLFDMDIPSKKLSAIDQDYFHHMIARILFAAKRTCLDIQVTVTFLYTKVSEPTIQDYQKLTTVITYL